MRRYMLPIILFLTDMVAICISIWLASIIRFMDTGNSYTAYVSSLAVYMPVYVLCHAFCFYIFKLYNRVWKYAGIKEMLSIVGAGDAGNIILRDLRQRDPIQLDMKTFGKYLQGKTVLVTGAGGSIGSEICRQVLRQQMIELNKMTGDEEIIAQMQKMIPTYTPNHFSA